MTILRWPPSTGDVQPIENGCFTGSSPVWPINICLRLDWGIFTKNPALGYPHTRGEASPMNYGGTMIEEIYSNFYSMRGNLWN